MTSAQLGRHVCQPQISHHLWREGDEALQQMEHDDCCSWRKVGGGGGQAFKDVCLHKCELYGFGSNVIFIYYPLTCHLKTDSMTELSLFSQKSLIAINFLYFKPFL